MWDINVGIYIIWEQRKIENVFNKKQIKKELFYEKEEQKSSENNEKKV